MHDVHLRGRFVDLRPLRVEDAAVTLAWRLGQRARLLNSGAVDIGQQARWIGSRPSSEYNFIIALNDGRSVGMLSLIEVNLTNRHAEPARFLIGENRAVAGIPAAVEAMQLLYGFAFDDLGLVRLFGTIVADNRRMAKWQEFLGMRLEGRMRRHLFLDGQFRDSLVYGLLEDEYRRDTLPRMRALVEMAGAEPRVEEVRIANDQG